MPPHTPVSKSVEHNSPKNIIQRVEQVFGTIYLDPCANPLSNIARTNYILPHNDGLIDPWLGNTFMNPPYGKGWWRMQNGQRYYYWPSDREELKKQMAPHEFKAFCKSLKPVSIANWLEKAWCSSNEITPVIGLIPVYPDTRGWQDFVWGKAVQIAFPRGRLHFDMIQKDGSIKTGPAPMACALPLWCDPLDTELKKRFVDTFSEIGYVL